MSCDTSATANKSEPWVSLNHGLPIASSATSAGSSVLMGFLIPSGRSRLVFTGHKNGMQRVFFRWRAQKENAPIACTTGAFDLQAFPAYLPARLLKLWVDPVP